MSANINIAGEARGEVTTLNADITVEVGYAPSRVEFLNLTNDVAKTFQVKAASGEVEPFAAQTPADAVDYSTVEGGTVGDAKSAGFTIKAALADFNDNGAGEVVQWIARR